MRVLKSGGPAFSAGRRATRGARRGVVIELALAVVLFIGAMVLTQTWRNLSVIDQGFDADRVFEGGIAYDDTKHPDIEARTRVLDEVGTRLLAHPAVEGFATRGHFHGLRSAAAGRDSTDPRSGFHRLYLPERPDVPADGGPEPLIWENSVSENFFQVMGIPILRGRSFSASDGPGSAPVAIVSAEMAKLVWPGEEALGRQIRVGKGGPLLTVIGIARDIRFTTSSQHGMQAGPKQSIYYSIRQVDGGWPDIVVRARGNPELAPAAILGALRASDLTVDFGPETFAERERNAMLGPRVAGAFMGTFALVALLLATLGIYGVLAYGVADRTREIGIRIALGGTTRDVIALVVRDGMRFVALGLAIGVALSFAVTPLLRRFVWGVSMTDPTILAFVLAAFSAVALLGCWIPARRATHVQPMEALRQD